MKSLAILLGIFYFQNMAGGFGSISGMIKSLKDNNRLRNQKKTFKDRKETGFAPGSKPLKFKSTMTKEELQAFRLQQERKMRKTQITTTVIVTVFLSSLAALLIWLNL